MAGCGYRVTYDDAFPPQPLNFPRWDPPDSIAFAIPDPPPVSSVVHSAEYYYQLNPRQGEPAIDPTSEAAIAAVNAGLLAPPGSEKKTPSSTRSASSSSQEPTAGAPVSVAAAAAAADSSVIDSAVVDSLGTSSAVGDSTVGDSVAVPEIRVELSRRLSRAYEQRALEDLAVAENLAEKMKKTKLTDAQQDHLRSVFSFIRQAKEALDRKDYEGASNLALKARTLSTSMAEDEP